MNGLFLRVSFIHDLNRPVNSEILKDKFLANDVSYTRTNKLLATTIKSTLVKMACSLRLVLSVNPEVWSSKRQIFIKLRQLYTN